MMLINRMWFLGALLFQVFLIVYRFKYGYLWALYGLILISGLIIYYLHDKRIYTDLEKVSRLIQNYLDGEKLVELAPLKDDLISKIQHQIFKLTGMLDSHYKKEIVERERLEQLIGDISHQLKTPVTNLKMYTELISSEVENPDFYDAFDKQSNKLEWLVDSLLQLSKVEAGCIELKIESANLGQTVLNALGNIHVKAKKKNISVEFNPTNIYIEHDIKWTGEAIYNILDNAVKYSPRDSMISIEIVESEMFTKLSIKDRGIGIAEEELSSVFKRFYRSPKVHDYEGIGIGLYLSQMIMNKQKGYIYALSSDNGSCLELNFRNSRL